MEVTVNTTNNENAKITLDEKALTSLIKDIVGSQATTDFARALSAVKNMTDEAERRSQFWRNVDAKEVFRNNLEQAVNACTNCVNLSDIEAQTTTPTATTIPPVPPVPPVVPPTATATTQVQVTPTEAKVEEETKEEKEDVNMEINISEIVAQAKKEAKEEAENEMSKRLIYFEIGRMQKGQLIELAKDWMDTRNVENIERNVTIRSTKYCMEYREAFDAEATALNQLKDIKNDKFDRFLGILRDVAWICE